ncbi:MAG: spore germination protein GerW family protein [Syntrophomonadaceae bacterium]|nr:spore germination protein GerW family protein [Syntrophomonadaceae bacterium]
MDFSQTLGTLFEQMNDFFRSDMVVGKPITAEGVIIVPLINVTFGAGSAAISANGRGGRHGDSGGATAGGGAGGHIEPVAVIVVNNGHVSALSLKGGSHTPIDSLINMVPEIMDKISPKKPSE